LPNQRAFVSGDGNEQATSPETLPETLPR
jgi:hypothetical protein